MTRALTKETLQWTADRARRDLADHSCDVGVWLCHLDRYVSSRVGGPARYSLAVAEEIARVLTALGTDAEPREVTS